ncbi:GFA family protein [Sphingomonas lacusdianchii]|uniref:GFA family protein n=1 Tax=Sphingomonas lacusdianchii TaxID=2917992 RepID=UPI001F5827CA|nr:GFA family protein [Sphingomonas sp. JXJ CY 53]
MEWQAECNCGQLRATCADEPDRISVCHCTNCKRWTGSAFAWNASFPAEAVTTAGERHSFARATDSGRTNVYHFCPTCGLTVFYDVEMRPGMISVPAGAFARAGFPPPTVQVFDHRRVAWCTIDEG